MSFLLCCSIMLFFYTVPLSISHVMYAGCISSLPYRPPSCNLHIHTSSRVCSVPAPVSAPCLLPYLHPLSAAFIPRPYTYSSYHQNSLITSSVIP